MAARYRATISTPHGPRRCFEATLSRSSGSRPLVARFGGIPLTRQKTAVITDRQPAQVIRRKELITRFLTGRCEICGHTSGTEVHQVSRPGFVGGYDALASGIIIV
jgi:hypothetical protein